MKKLIAALGLILVAFGLVGYGESEVVYEHRLVVNHTGVQHFYFDERQPPLSTDDPVRDINRALVSLELSPVASLPTTEKRGRRGYIGWDSYGPGELTVYEGPCRQGQGNCIRKIVVTPSRRDMMRNQAERLRHQRFISSDEFGREWPFTVPFGVVYCRGTGEVYFMTEDRTTHAINGLARGASPNTPDATPIWKDVPTGTPGGGKVSIHRVVQTGLELCK